MFNTPGSQLIMIGNLTPFFSYESIRSSIGSTRKLKDWIKAWNLCLHFVNIFYFGSVTCLALHMAFKEYSRSNCLKPWHITYFCLPSRPKAEISRNQLLQCPASLLKGLQKAKGAIGFQKQQSSPMIRSQSKQGHLTYGDQVTLLEQ